MTNILDIKGLRKNFGSVKVLKGLDMSVPEGSVFGFIGENGAGKTTTMKIILGLLESDGGEVFVCGERIRYADTLSGFKSAGTGSPVGFLPDVPEFYPYMNPMEYLTLCGEISGMKKTEIQSRGRGLLELVGLSKANRRIGGFSRGMKQRLGIAQALLNQPKLLICDEPTSALDPAGRKEILDILDSIRGQTTVIFSTHILSDVERVCDRVAFLHNGEIVLSSALSDLKLQNKSRSISLEFDKEIDSKEILLALKEKNIFPSKIETGDACLESLYLNLTEVIQP
jgi:ABC-2 type transport system ATP-binding protein